MATCSRFSMSTARPPSTLGPTKSELLSDVAFPPHTPVAHHLTEPTFESTICNRKGAEHVK